ncbi:hypothetical protein FALBO_1310 [Fusarium albosuccineum]|uniref:Uncharacterized protein n=1 Tax=Fusarium albosuccineum TaxID=1237068 RepID=A0A8H4LLW7_9HYPO|nr:hypothetical protein FALBO_1310 [Fusarium albosuccineum]
MTSQTAGPSRLFQTDRSVFSSHYDVNSNRPESVSFYVDVSSFTPGKPDLTLHKGVSTNDPVVAACHLPKFSGGLKFGLASPAGPDLMNWEELTRQWLLTASEYR